MLRQLLTLLAVFTGLTAAVEPARALHTGVQTVHLTESAAACQVQSGAIAERGQERRQRIEERDKFCTRPVLVISTPTVMLRIDRAHE